MNRKGFTLIELLIVVVIIGILAAIAIPKFANTKEKAYIASMKSDLRNLVTAEEAYFADSIKYTTAVSCANPAPAGSVSFCMTTGNTLRSHDRYGRRRVDGERHQHQHVEELGASTSAP
jgi:prepilin-type N-terminal cleavage/methylation domain-containing protein